MWARVITLCSRLGFAFARRRLDEETRYEIDTHLDLLVDNYIRSGLTPEEAYSGRDDSLGASRWCGRRFPR